LYSFTKNALTRSYISRVKCTTLKNFAGEFATLLQTP